MTAGESIPVGCIVMLFNSAQFKSGADATCHLLSGLFPGRSGSTEIANRREFDNYPLGKARSIPLKRRSRAGSRQDRPEDDRAELR
jgi:hypothetical protein